MALLGFARAGSSALGPSKMYDAMPYEGYKNVKGAEFDGWIQEFLDSIGCQWDVINEVLVKADARSNLLDPNYTPTDAVADNFATPTTSPALVTGVTDTMLDVLMYIACGIYPVDTNYTVAMKQELVSIGWKALRRKWTRRQIFNIAAALAGGVIDGWTATAYQTSMILPDGAPSPGYSSAWVPASGVSAAVRPWIFQGERNALQKVFPAWAELGVGYSQFRAGYSAAGEPVFTSGARINLLANEHFSAWTAGVPDSWTQSGGATLTQYSSAYCNLEFSSYAARIDLTGAGIASYGELSQTVTVDSEKEYVFQADYIYYNAQQIDILEVQIIDANYVTSTATNYYYDVENDSWGTAVVNNTLPVSASSSDRKRYTFTLPPQRASETTNNRATSTIQINVLATSDGTATTQTTYDIFRVGVYEKFSTTQDAEATGERSLWLPLSDATGYTTWSGSLTALASVMENQNGDRTVLRQRYNVGGPIGDYHPALSDYGYRSTRSWTNLLLGSSVFDTGSDYTLTSCSAGAGTNGLVVGEGATNEHTFTSSAANARIQTTATLGDPSSKTYIGGIFVKRVTTGSYPITIALRSNNASYVASQSYVVSPATTSTDGKYVYADGWQRLTVGPYTFPAALASLKFDITWGDAASQQIGVSSPYVYNVTNNIGLLYPPVIQTPIHATATLGATTLKANTYTVDTDSVHPLTRRQLIKISEGMVRFKVVPTFGCISDRTDTMPSPMYLFDVGQSATLNRLSVYIDYSAPNFRLLVQRYDNIGSFPATSILLNDFDDDTVGLESVAWLRDKQIDIVVRWLNDGTFFFSANGITKPSALTSSTNWSDAAISKIRIGCDLAGANQFDGIIKDLEVLQVGLAY